MLSSGYTPVTDSLCPSCNTPVHQAGRFVEGVGSLTDTRSLPLSRNRPYFQVMTPTSLCPLCSQNVPLPGTCYSDLQTHMETHTRLAQEEQFRVPPRVFHSLQVASPMFWCELCFRDIPVVGKNSAEQQDHITAHEVGQQAPDDREERIRLMLRQDDEMLRNAWNRYGANDQVYADVPYEPSGKAGLSAEEVRQVVEVDFPATAKMTCECVVCREELHAGERVKILPCAHLFHPKCIDQWLTKHAQCPIDRMKLGYQ